MKVATPLTAELRTAHLPTLDLTAAIGALAGGSSWFTRWMERWLRPELRVETPFGRVTSAPHGSPGETDWPLLPLVLAGVLALLLVFAGLGAVSLFRR